MLMLWSVLIDVDVDVVVRSGKAQRGFWILEQYTVPRLAADVCGS